MAAARAQLEDGLRGTPNDPALLRSRGILAWATGHPGASVRDLRRASVLDPRSPTILATLAAVHYNLRQLEEAEVANRLALALDSLNLGQIQLRALLHAARGDVAAARASLTQVPAILDQATLIAFVASYGGYPWLLSEPQQEALLKLRSSAFDGPGLWALTLAGALVQRGERMKAGAYADTAVTFFREALLEQADRPVTQVLYGLALAWVGDSSAAHRVADQVRRLAPLAADSGLNWNENRGAAWIYASIGAKDEAIALLDSLLRYPGALTPGFLRVDRSWDPLRSDPRFQRLLTIR
jgi:tetratricopeptide (TPR) repeat protein